MRWVITEDLTEEPDAVGVGSFPLDGPLIQVPYRFQLLDGDGQVYFRGQSDDSDGAAAFWPLEWAETFAGCTEIQYWRNGCWETL